MFVVSEGRIVFIVSVHDVTILDFYSYLTDTPMIIALYLSWCKLKTQCVYLRLHVFETLTHTQRVEVQSELPLSVSAVFE
jgi:hypothetical protein